MWNLINVKKIPLINHFIPTLFTLCFSPVGAKSLTYVQFLVPSTLIVQGFSTAGPIRQQHRAVGTVLGTMSIPQQLDLQGTVKALQVFKAAGHTEVDTAIMYERGQTEKTLGEIIVFRRVLPS